MFNKRFNLITAGIICTALMMSSVVPVFAEQTYTVDTVGSSDSTDAETDTEDNVSGNELSSNNTDTRSANEMEDDVTVNTTSTSVSQKKSGKDLLKNKFDTTYTLTDYEDEWYYGCGYVVPLEDDDPVYMLYDRARIYDAIHMIIDFDSELGDLTETRFFYSSDLANAYPELLKKDNVKVIYVAPDEYNNPKEYDDALGNVSRAAATGHKGNILWWLSYASVLSDEDLESTWKARGSMTMEDIEKIENGTYEDSNSSEESTNDYTTSESLVSQTVGEYTVTYPSKITFDSGKKAQFGSGVISISGNSGTLSPSKIKVKKATKTGSTTFTIKVDGADKETKKLFKKTKLPVEIVAYNVSGSDTITVKRNSKGVAKKVTVNGIKCKKNEWTINDYDNGSDLTFSGRFNGTVSGNW